MANEIYKKGARGELVIERPSLQVKKISHLVEQIEFHNAAIEKLIAELGEAKKLEIEGAAEAVERFTSE